MPNFLFESNLYFFTSKYYISFSIAYALVLLFNTLDHIIG